METEVAPPRPHCCWRAADKAMSLSCFFNPHHGCLLQADGHGEVWADWNSTSKFFQYGWRCTTNEDSYSNKTLLGNWNQERYDLRKMLQPRPLPSQYSHYFETTYSANYTKEMPHSTRRVIREPHWYPGHQPELEPPPCKPTARSCYMIDFEPPYGRKPCPPAVEKPQKPEEHRTDEVVELERCVLPLQDKQGCEKNPVNMVLLPCTAPPPPPQTLLEARLPPSQSQACVNK